MTDARMKTIAVLGSTGSIGTNTLDVVRRNRHLYQVYSLVAGRNIEVLTAQILEFRPKLAVVATPEGMTRLAECLAASGLAPADWPQLRSGDAARVEAVRASASANSGRPKFHARLCQHQAGIQVIDRNRPSDLPPVGAWRIKSAVDGIDPLDALTGIGDHAID